MATGIDLPPAPEGFASKYSVATSPTNHQNPTGPVIHDSLVALRKDLADLKAHGAPKLSDIQALAERTWKANMSFEAYVKKIEKEKDALTRLVESVWTQFDDLLLPLWRIDDSLMPIYEELALLQTQLEALRNLPIDSDERGDALRLIQERLHRVEDENIRDGKVVPGIARLGSEDAAASASRVPSGQAVVIALLNRCYRLVRVIQEGESEVAPVLLPLQTRLENMIEHLRSMQAAFATALSQPPPYPRPEAVVDPLQLRLVQEQLDGIDSIRKEGRFLDSTGRIPEGQAILTELLEEAYDLVHECLVEQEALGAQNSVKVAMSELGTVAAEVRDKVVEARDVLVKAGNEEKEVVQGAYETLRGAAGAMRKAVVGVPLAALDAASASVVSVLSSGLGYVARFLERSEPVDSSFLEVANELAEIRSSLKGLRNQRNTIRLRRATAAQDPSSSTLFSKDEQLSAWKQLEVLQTRLDEIDNMRTDGKFLNERGEVGGGQGYLHSLLDECFTLLFELGDDLESEEAY